MSLTLVTHKLWTPERIARTPVRCKGGWMFRHPPKDLWRYNRYARWQAAREWAMYGGAALTSIIGGAIMGLPAVGTITSIGGMASFPPELPIAAPSVNNTTMTASGHYVGFVFRAPKTGSIRQIGVKIATATGTPKCDFSIETVDATTGFPTGTNFTTNSNITAVAITQNAWNDSGNFTADASVNKGDLCAAVVRWNNGTVNVSSESAYRSYFPYHVLNTGSNTKGSAVISSIGVKYSDGTYAYIPATEPASALNTTTFSSASNPNHRGGAWTIPVNARAIGCWTITQGNDYTAIIAADSWDGTADDDGTSNLSISVDKDEIATTGFGFFLSTTSLTMTANTIYRALLKPGGSNCTGYDMSVNAAAILDQMSMGQAYQLTTANNPSGSGSWTQTTTKRPYTGFWIDAFDDGAGSASTSTVGVVGDGSTW